MQNQTFKLSLKPNDYPPNLPFVYADQYDVGRTFVATVYDADGSLYTFNGETVTLVGTKPSGTGFSYTATASGNTVTFETTGQMTVVAGNVTCGIIIEKDGDRIGTLHFVLHIQPAALSSDTIIDSDDFGSIISDAVEEWMDEHGVVIDDTLSVAGAAADAKATGDAIDELKSAIDDAGLTDEAKEALLACFANVAWIGDDGQDYYDALEEALYNTTWAITNNLTNCTTSNEATAVTKGGAYSATITASAGYVMTGATVSITMGGNDITATAYSNGVISIPAVTGALVITISAAAKTVSSITAVYAPSGTVYDTDTLDSLKDDLVVTATYDDTSTEVIPAADYTLSGSMSHGTQTITVTFSGATTTFTVTISEHWSYGISDLNKVTGAFTTEASATCGVAMKLSETNRRSFYLTHGVTSVAKMQSGSIISQTSEYYPVKVPEGATGISVSITPSTQYVGATLRSLTDGVYTNVEQPGYKQGTSTFTISGGAPDNYWLMISTKYNSGGTSYPTEPTALDIVFTS
jgi:hypothetical protein